MRIPLLAVAAMMVLTACGGDTPSAAPTTAASTATTTAAPAAGTTATSAAPADPAFADPAAAAAGGKIGPGTACPVSATIPTAAKWKAKDASAAGMTSGGVTLQCEVDAKPAGVLGFIRVYSYKDMDAKQALAATLAMPGFGGTKTAERALTIGGKDGAEAALKAESSGPGRAFAAGGVVVLWRGVDEEEFTSGLPAYVLARTSVTFA